MWCIKPTAAYLIRGALVALSISTAASAVEATPRHDNLTSANAIRGSIAAVRAPVSFFRIDAVLARYDARRSPDVPVPVGRAATVDDVVPPQPTESGAPFGLATFRAPEGLVWEKWRGVQGVMQTEVEALRNCRLAAAGCSQSEVRFLEIIRTVGGLNQQARVAGINREINRAIRYLSDATQHGVVDRWSSPLATLASGRGDCEDYAILKYALLRESGTPDADLKLLLVKDHAARQDHAVLAVRLEGRWLVLDNRWDTLSESRKLRHVMPLFALGGDGVDLFATPFAVRAFDEGEGAIEPAAPEPAHRDLQQVPII
jgi:predicted transglutaminase-like cysteine proteinase